MSRNRPRALVLTPRFPYPVVGGDRLRIHEICKSLADEYSLTLLSLCETEEEMNGGLVTDALFDKIECVMLPRYRSYLNVMLSIPTRIPLQIAYYQSSVFAKRARVLAEEHDICVAHLIRAGHYIKEMKHIPTILEMTDAISLNYKRVRSVRSLSLKALIYRYEFDRLHKYETDAISQFSLVNFTSAEDARFLCGNEIPSHVKVTPNGVNTIDLNFVNRVNCKNVGVFIGNMNTVQNMDACIHFIEDIMPNLREDDLAEFRVVGRISDSGRAKLCGYERVTVTGEVPSIPEVVADAKFGICSVRLGAGIQNKVLEYMALGLPVVTSRVGYEGLAAREGSDLLVASEPAEFANMVRRLAEDPLLYEALGRNGRAYVEQNHNWEANLAPFVAGVREVRGTNSEQLNVCSDRLQAS
ncbi:glycosyltransferase [Sphingomonas cavernae]|uniref:Glycosyltransferase n=1 Tax=Sphingomonas cavernae TaxID=2320861 RepID=A0A418VZK2_9SPHN|nr:glycosyltransferase [Sphingomonas cavernae]RJF91544.1 glycosyltransferase [Sphingomonas cavernae]